jgi:Protein of unknown function (DUF2892)
MNTGEIMTTNMGNLDRGLRAIVGLVLLYLAYIGMFSTWAWAGYAAYVVGAVLLVTAAVGMCPLYTLFGWNTCATKDKSYR